MVLLESHVEFIKNHSSTTVERVMSSLTYKYEGDFYGLLMALKNTDRISLDNNENKWL